MKLVVDTNIFFSGLIKDSITRKILLNPEYEFYVPDFFLYELKKYEQYLIKKTNLTKNEFKLVLDKLLDNIYLIPIKEYSEKLTKARNIIGDIDKKDIPFIAVALSIKNDGIWSNDKDFFKQSVIKIYTTNDLILKLKEKETGESNNQK
ncbi:MAG: PIN domain-containing protein [Promethearchaeota archaeon]|nr:MAG: PIN domain-containing protein [Candidatus Lokiarchaeota archaeon]